MLVALIAMVGGFIAQHTGLTQAVAGVISRVAKCHKCTVFWCVLISTTFVGTPLYIAIAEALLCSYVSNWLGLAFMWLGKKYEELWQKLSR